MQWVTKSLHEGGIHDFLPFLTRYNLLVYRGSKEDEKTKNKDEDDDDGGGGAGAMQSRRDAHHLYRVTRDEFEYW